MRPTNRIPTHPGEIPLQDFMLPNEHLPGGAGKAPGDSNQTCP